MFSSYQNVLQLLSLLKLHNIKRFVVSPGSRHIPIVISMEADPWFELYSIVDERSASFFALGLIQNYNQPAGIICTSGTAAANYCSAITEAYYQELPLLVITADRAPSLLDQHEDQMIHQTSLYNGIAKFTTNLPIVHDAMTKWHCNRLINEAILELNHHGKGPVQINIPVIEHTDSFSSPSIPQERKIERFTLEDAKEFYKNIFNYLQDKNILVVFGEGFPLNKEEQKILQNFIRNFNCVVLADKMSNCHGEGVIENSFALVCSLSQNDVRELSPDIIISVRSNYSFNPEFKGLVNRFKNCKKIENWYVSPSGKIVDPFKCLNKVFEMNEFTFFRMMNEYRQEVKESGNVFREIWETLSELIEEPNPQYGHLYTIKRFLAQIPGNSILHVANSNSIRVVQHFKILPSVDVHCNRGTDGIDGSMSSMIGQASSTDKIVFLMIGDLSFFYDMNALWNRHVGKNVRILLNNNGGGAIMHMPKRPDFAAEHLPNFISAKHSTSARAWAIDRGFKYLTASTREEVEEQMQIFTNEKTEGPIIFEVFSDMLEDTEILKGYYQDIKRDTLEEKLRKRAGVVKRKIYSILGRS